MENTQVLDRVFAIIEAVAGEPDGIGVTEIGRKTDLPKSTVHRIANTLVQKNYFKKDDFSGRYALGYKFIAIAGDYLGSLDIRTAASPFMHGLAASVGTTVHLAVLQGTNAVYIDKIQPYTHTCMYSEIGKPIELYCSALGKSLLTGFSEEDLDLYIDRLEPVKYTENTIGKQQLKDEVIKAKTTGITYDYAEHEAGIYCLAAPVKDFRDKVIAAVSISSTNPAILKEEKYINALKNAAAGISRLFGKE